MTLEQYEREVAMNRPVYEALRDQIRRDYAGQHVVLGEGKLLAVAPSFDKVRIALEQVQPAPQAYWIFPAEAELTFELPDEYFHYRWDAPDGPGMNCETFELEVAINRLAYQRLRDQIRRDFAGQYVALGLGRILAIAPTYREADAAVKRMHPELEIYWVFPAEEEPGFEALYNISIEIP